MSRRKVRNGTIDQTTGGLKNKDLFYKNGRIKSKKASKSMKIRIRKERNTIKPNELSKQALKEGLITKKQYNNLPINLLNAISKQKIENQ
ncbi:MAG: hypothetical protein CMG46_02395 [Candidatus Marinimicrobia bacterium]|nr:hypothetical protein [Candidatus Neomarinimicrobiota bacterium]|tara:strand:- start:501 stop:770 length:270 start_codon:yes stop_codon:yes gene_type:complete